MHNNIIWGMERPLEPPYCPDCTVYLGPNQDQVGWFFEYKTRARLHAPNCSHDGGAFELMLDQREQLEKARDLPRYGDEDNNEDYDWMDGQDIMGSEGFNL